MEQHYYLFRKSTKHNEKSTKKWYYYFYREDGSRVQRACKGCRTQKEALEFIKQLEYEYSRPLSVKDVAKDMFLKNSEYIERLNLLGKKLSDKTLRDYRHYVELIIEKFGDVPVERVCVKDVINYLIGLDKSGSWKNCYCEVFSKIFDEAIWQTNGAIRKPVFPRFARDSKKADILTKEEMNSFLNPDKWEDETLYLLYLCTATCGLRLGEARALRVNQFRFELNVLVVDGFCKRDGYRTNYNKKGSNEDTKMRVVILPDFTKSVVAKYIEEKKLHKDDFLFTKDDLPLRQEYCESVFKRQIKKCGIKKDGRKIVPHSLRFTYVTLMRQNLDAETVKKLVGHSTIQMTDYYTRIAIPEMASSLQVARNAVNKLI